MTMRVMHVFANNAQVPYLSWFAERAVKDGDIHFIFLVMYPSEPAMVKEMRAHGFDAQWIRFDQTKRKWGMLRALPILWWWMLQYRPDVVHSHLFDDTLPAMVAAWAARIKVRLFTRQDTGFHLNYAPRWSFLDRLTARLATRVVAVSNDARELMITREHIPAQKIGMVHHGIPPERYLHADAARMERLRLRFGLEQAYPIIGTLARFIEWKGYRYLVDAAQRIVSVHPQARFLFSGVGPQEAEVRQWVKEAGLEQAVVFTGWVDRDDVPSLYRLMDVYLHAADHEPFGFIYAEAMFAGVPVVSTPTGAALDAIVDGVSGMLVRERSGAALAQGVERLLNSEPRQIGAAGKAVALGMYTFEQMWQGYRSEYQACMERVSEGWSGG